MCSLDRNAQVGLLLSNYSKNDFRANNVIFVEVQMILP